MAVVINGNGTLTGVSVGGLPDGIVDTDMLAANAVTAAKASGSVKGITVADNWIITSSYSTNGTSNMDINWARQSSTLSNIGIIGSAMTQSSGVFTFPSTGVYLVLGSLYAVTSGGRTFIGMTHDLSTNSGSSFDSVLTGYQNGYQNNAYVFVQSVNVYDITNTSTHKMRFRTDVSDTISVTGSNTNKTTGVSFIRLGDT